MNPLIIKIGGIFLNNKKILNNFFTILNKYHKKHKRSLIILHGGSVIINKFMQKLSIPIIKKKGIRVTPLEQMDLITGSLSGIVNKNFLSYLIKNNMNSIGLILADGDSIRVTNLEKNIGSVGSPHTGSFILLQKLLIFGYFPVISSIGITYKGKIMNVNADHAATVLAEMFNADIVFLSDMSGILDGKGKCITEIKKEKSEKWIAQGMITDGMIIKVRSALKAASKLGRWVDISSLRNIEKFPNFFNGFSIGTRIFAEINS